MVTAFHRRGRGGRRGSRERDRPCRHRLRIAQRRGRSRLALRTSAPSASSAVKAVPPICGTRTCWVCLTRSSMLALRAALVALLAAALLAVPAERFTPIAVTVRERGRRRSATLAADGQRAVRAAASCGRTAGAGGRRAAAQRRRCKRGRWCAGPTARCAGCWSTRRSTCAPRREHHLRVQPGTAPAPRRGGQRDARRGRRRRSTPARCAFLMPEAALRDRRRRAAARQRRPAHRSAQRDCWSPASAPGRRSRRRSVAVIESGPLRARVELQGTYGNGFDYVVRVEAYAGQPFVRVWHTFINRHPTPYVSVPRIGVELPLLGEALPVALSLRGDRRADRSPARLPTTACASTSPTTNPMRVGDDASAPASWPAGSSWQASARTVGVAARWIWQEYPQSIALRARPPGLQPLGARSRSGQAPASAPPRRTSSCSGSRRRARTTPAVGAAWRAAARRRRSACAWRAAARCRRRSRRRAPARVRPQGPRRRAALLPAQRRSSSGTTAARCTARTRPASVRAPARTACGTGATGTSAATRTRPRAPTAGATSSTTRRTVLALDVCGQRRRRRLRPDGRRGAALHRRRHDPRLPRRARSGWA